MAIGRLFVVAITIAMSTWILPSAAQQNPSPYVQRYWQPDSGQRVEIGTVIHHGREIPLIGFLTKPSDAPGQAAVIYSGGCNGFDSLGRQYMAEHLGWLREEGYVVLNIDGLRPRGISREGGTCDQQWKNENPLYVSDTRRAQDAMIALTWLAQQPFVDPKRVGLFGFSAGGGAAFSAAVHYAESYEFLRVNAFGAYSDRFAAIFSVYPTCFDKADTNRTKIRSNLMIVIGELDTSSKPEWCKRFSAIEGIEYELKIYPGVYHSYMLPLKPRYVTWANGTRHWFAPDIKAKDDTVQELKGWFRKYLKQ